MKKIIGWLVIAAMAIGGTIYTINSGASFSGVIGLIGLMLIAGSYVSTKSGGIDGRYKIGCTSLVLGLICLAIAFIIAWNE